MPFCAHRAPNALRGAPKTALHALHQAVPVNFLTIDTVPLPLATVPVEPTPFARPQIAAERALILWHLTSLDAPTVALVWSLAFAWCSNLHLRPWTVALLALTTWSIYVVDRLLDVRAAMGKSSRRGLRPRHTFHWLHRNIMLPLALFAACIAAAILLAFLPSIIRERGSVMAIAAFTYLSGVHLGPKARSSTSWHPHWFPNKEFCVAILFTAGCALPSWPRLHGPHVASFAAFWIPVGCFAALAWLNCACIAKWEAADALPGPEFAVGEEKIHGANQCGPSHFFPAVLLAIMSLIIAAIALAAHPRTAALLVACAASALFLALLHRLRDRIAPTTLRAAADLALLTPVVLLFR